MVRRESAVVAAVLGGIFAVCGARAQLRSEPLAVGLSFPVALIQDPTDPTVQFVVEQRGRIRALRGGSLETTDFLNLTGVVHPTGEEQGLLGLAFSPDYAQSRRFYVNFTNLAGNTVVARFKRSASNPLVADPGSRFDLRWGGPTGQRFIQQGTGLHNGGTMVFGPDGYLYIGMGDGGGAGDPVHRAQDPNTLLGKMLRIDVNVADPNPEGYRIPPDNPFLDGRPVSALGEIWAFGLRNPWKFSFDEPARGGTGGLIIGDVGQDEWEEIDYEPANRGGRNYGWRIREASHPFNNSLPPAYTPLTDPIFEYPHNIGAAVAGGYVYRGTILGSEYYGRYFFGDFHFGKVWSVAITISMATGEAIASDLREHTAELGGFTALGNISSLGMDSAGELYLVSYGLGHLLRIRADVEVVAPESLAIFRGVAVSGNLSSLLRSEDNRLAVRPGVTQNSNEAPVQVVLEGVAPLSSITQLIFSLEASASVTGIRQRIELFNFRANAFEEIDSRMATTSDSTVEVTIGADLSRFLQLESRLMRVRLSWGETATAGSYPWQARIDQAVWKVRFR